MPIEQITLNFAPSIRHDSMQGRAYIVAPMAMLTEGVFNGSNGPLFYSKAELAKTPVTWNMKPVVVYHPSINGQGISACDPTVLEVQQVGVVMNTHYDDKLRAEAWLEVERLKTVDVRVLNALEAGEIMEVSTGLFTDNVYDPGNYGGKDYELVATNHRPDHLAILPDKIGACSIAAGAGLLQLNELAKLTKVDGLNVDRIHELALHDTRRMVGNAMSHGDTYSLVSKSVRDRFGENTYLLDVYDKFFIYELGNKLYRLAYKVKKAVVELVGSPAEVTRTTQYRKADGTIVVNTATTNTKENAVDKTKIVNGLIANADTAWAEGDREFLMSQNDDQLAKFNPVGNAFPPKKKDDEDDDDMKKKKAAAKAKADNEVAVANAAAAGAAQLKPQPITLEQMPPEMLAVYNHGAAALTAERTTLIGNIAANKQNVFTGEQLAAMDLPQLQGLAALAAQPADSGTPGQLPANYAGQAGAAPVGNAAAGAVTESPLLMPTMNFEPVGAGA